MEERKLQVLTAQLGQSHFIELLLVGLDVGPFGAGVGVLSSALVPQIIEAILTFSGQALVVQVTCNKIFSEWKTRI